MKISENFFSFFPSLNQYFPIFHMRQVKTSLERKKNFRLSRGVAVREICIDDISAVLSATAYKFRLPFFYKAGRQAVIARPHFDLRRSFVNSATLSHLS